MFYQMTYAHIGRIPEHVGSNIPKAFPRIHVKPWFELVFLKQDVKKLS